MCDRLNCVVSQTHELSINNKRYNICKLCWEEFTRTVCCFYYDEDTHKVSEGNMSGLLDQFILHDASIVSFETLLRRRRTFLLSLLEKEYVFNFLSRTFPFVLYTDVLFHQTILSNTCLENPNKHSTKVELSSNNRDFIFTLYKYGPRQWNTLHEIRRPINFVSL